MKTSKNIKRIRFYGRHVAHTEESTNLYITVGNSENIKNNPKCPSLVTDASGAIIVCELSGRYIGVYSGPGWNPTHPITIGEI